MPQQSGSRNFSGEKAKYPHLEQADRVGSDLRDDVESAFQGVEAEIDAIQAGTGVTQASSTFFQSSPGYALTTGTEIPLFQAPGAGTKITLFGMSITPSSPLGIDGGGAQTWTFTLMDAGGNPLAPAVDTSGAAIPGDTTVILFAGALDIVAGGNEYVKLVCTPAGGAADFTATLALRWGYLDT